MQILIMVFDTYNPVRFKAHLLTVFQQCQADFIIYLNK